MSPPEPPSPLLSGLQAGTAPLMPVLAPLADAFAAAGHELYLVGGIVRDLLLGPDGESELGSDVDLTTGARPELIKALLKGLKGSAVGEPSALWTQGERFGTIGARLGSVDPGDGLDVEITTFRAESYDPDSRNPVVAFGDRLEDDLARRDFTINAMAVALGSDLELIDPFDGLVDLEQRRLRTPLSADVSFTDDPLRILRAARFIARFGLEPAADLEAAAAELGQRLNIVSVERVAGELERLLALADPTAGFDFLRRTGVLVQAVPAFAALDAEAAAEACALASKPGPPTVRRAAFLWPLARLAGRDGPASALSQLRYSNQDRKTTLALLGAIADAGGGERVEAGAGRRAVAAVGHDHLDDLLTLAATTGCEGLVATVEALRRSEDLTDLGSPLSGAEIIALTGLEPGPLVGRAHRWLAQQRLDRGPLGQPEAAALVRGWLVDQAGSDEHPGSGLGNLGH